ncbi:MAG TPA: DEDD exonuclease domain-containing protein [Acidimicrobiales bacterium]|nr:DEDD exonuclease domain-containing protein [Acidimicrobiales bacterium]
MQRSFEVEGGRRHSASVLDTLSFDTPAVEPPRHHAGANAEQRSLLGTPLVDVTFVVVDLETTGGSPADCAVTEIGAVKLRGGECLGTFQTLVNPGLPIPPHITYLTGITQAMVLPAPRIETVLPSFLEFCRDAVLVGHNVRFDLSFLNAALAAAERPRLANRSIDTCALARRLVRDEVSDCRLGTLAAHFRVGHRPTHRALDDALATGEVMHALLERAGSLGVLTLDDLLELPTVKGHPMVAKLALTAGLPRKPGVYLFRDAGGRVLYVGKAVDLRRRVRSYFTGDDRRKVGALLRETQRIDHVVTGGELEASVLEVRLVAELLPRYNRQLKLWRRYAYVKLTLDERFPRLSVVRAPKRDDGCLYLGPLSSSATARLLVEAIESAVPIRRCRARPPPTPRAAPCTPAQLGVATCPCAGSITEEAYGELVDRVVRGLTCEPALLLQPLEERMRALAAAQRYEEAASVRERAAALSRALQRQRRLDALRQAGRVTVEVPGEGVAVLHRGRLLDGLLELDSVPEDGPVPRELADELAAVASYLEAKAARLRIVESERGLAWPLPRLPRYEPRSA